MNRRALQIVSLLLLLLMGTAVVHELLPHHSHADEHEGGQSCALCTLLAFTAVVVALVCCAAPEAVPTVPLPRAVAPRSPAFRRIRHPRSPPVQYS